MTHLLSVVQPKNMNRFQSLIVPDVNVGTPRTLSRSHNLILPKKAKAGNLSLMLAIYPLTVSLLVKHHHFVTHCIDNDRTV